VDAKTSLPELQNALINWANTPVDSLTELLVYLIGNGGNGYFEMDGGQDPKINLTVSVLDGWLDQIQNTTGCRVIVVYDACRAGSFLPLLTPPNGMERVVIAGASANESAWFLDDGEVSFSWGFWNSVFERGEIFTAFTAGKNMTQYLQNPVIASDGVKREAREETPIPVGRERILEPAPPIVQAAVCQPVELNEGTGATITSGPVTDAGNIGISRVWSRLISPELLYVSLDDPVIVAPTFKLDSTGSEGMYEKAFN
jgi:hypothetical protein